MSAQIINSSAPIGLGRSVLGSAADHPAEALERMRADIGSVDVVHVLFGDPHGIARSKALHPDAFLGALDHGMDFSPGSLVFDTGHAIAVSIDETAFVRELDGAGDMVVFPDIATWAVTARGGRRTGWVIGDERLRSGEPHPLSSRRVLREVVAEAVQHGWAPLVGIELEFYLLRLLGQGYTGAPGGFGVQGTPMAVELIDGGYQFNSTRLLEGALTLLAPHFDLLGALGSRLRTVEHESGPGQIEITFEPQDALAAADAVLLLRTWLKCFLPERGLHSSFMGLPALPGADPSGWHLHQSLRHTDGGPMFTGPDGGELGGSGRAYVAGLMRRTAEFALLSNPTVNAYHRFSNGHSLSPSRVAWAREHRGALVRVADGGAALAAHVENRIGDPAANPYLYIASQVSAGVEGVVDGLDLPPAAFRPQEDGETLPCSLGEAIPAFESSAAARRLVGPGLHQALVEIKRSEWARFVASEGDFRSGCVSDWEDREYRDEF